MLRLKDISQRVSVLCSIDNLLNFWGDWLHGSLEISRSKEFSCKSIKRFDQDNFLSIPDIEPVISRKICSLRCSFEFFSHKSIRQKIEIQIVHVLYLLLRPVISLSHLISTDWENFLTIPNIELGVSDLVLNALIHIIASLLIDIVIDWIREIAIDRDKCLAVDYSSKILFVFDCLGLMHSNISHLHWRHGLFIEDAAYIRVRELLCWLSGWVKTHEFGVSTL